MKPKINRKSDQYIPVSYDACQTPPWAAEPLLPYLKGLSLWEPAQGHGYLAQHFEQQGYYVFGTELNEAQPIYVRAPNWTGINFLTNTTILPPEINAPYAIVTNPPYSGKLKQAFTERCYYYFRKYGLPFALLMPVEFIGTDSAQEIFDQYRDLEVFGRSGRLQLMLLNTRVDFHMPEIGWSGKSTNKMRKNKYDKWVRQAGAQFPVAWYTVGLNLPHDLMFAKLKPYKMEVLDNPYVI